MDTILIIDLGSQTTQLIARRIRDIGVYTDIIPPDQSIKEIITADIRGIILSGSPYSIYNEHAPEIDEYLYSVGVPVLGICYGFHQIASSFGGNVRGSQKKEFGRSTVYIETDNPLFKDVPTQFVSWMSHGDSIQTLPEAFEPIAQSQDHIAAAWFPAKKIYGVQFHPEVSHCEYGNRILKNFAVNICNAKKEWNMEAYIHQSTLEIREKIGNRKVLLLISGGVDSTVVGGMLLKALKPEQVHLLHIDTGLMRKNETKEVTESLKQLGAKNLNIIDASEVFYNSLKGITEPEEKRALIGDLFITLQEQQLQQTDILDTFLAQGTLYTDLIESGKGVGKHASVIKTHHNVRSPLVEKKREAGLVIEPLDKLYKDEVRSLGKKIEISPEVIRRHPFPGPGLAIRIIGEVTKEKCDILREADYLYIQELKKRNLYDQIWQAFSVLLPVRSVGVAGDIRKYGWVLALRAVNSVDGMTADVYPFPTEDLVEISSLITNSIEEIGRVVYDISSKPPSTIEWE